MAMNDAMIMGVMEYAYTALYTRFPANAEQSRVETSKEKIDMKLSKSENGEGKTWSMVKETLRMIWYELKIILKQPESMLLNMAIIQRDSIHSGNGT